MKKLLVLLCALTACSKTAGKDTEKAGELAPVELPPGHPSVMPLPDPELNGGNVGRAPRRLTVQQLKNSILVTTEHQWTQIDNLAASLGRADFALVNSESTEPNLVFAKFLEDGAREVCLATARDDLNRPQATRVLWPAVPGTSRDFTTLSDAVIEENLATLALRFWGQPMSAPELTHFTTTFKTIATRAKTVNKPEQAWGSICIALMTDPRFITY